MKKQTPMPRFTPMLLFLLGLPLANGFDGTAVRAGHPTSAETPGGGIVGRVRLHGTVAVPKMLAVTKHRDFCGNTVRNESVQLGSNGELRNAVVFLRGPGLGHRSGHVPRITLDNVGCRFVPHVQVVRVGGSLLLLNSDPILHDAHGRVGGRTLFNDGLPTWRRVERRLDETGVLKIVCELHHAWMSAYVVVTPNDYFAVTDAQGRFLISGVPPGTYEIEFWHEKLGRIARTARVGKGRLSRIDVTFTAP